MQTALLATPPAVRSARPTISASFASPADRLRLSTSGPSSSTARGSTSDNS